MIPRTAQSILARVNAWRPARGTVLAALLLIPFGLYFVAANFPGHATTALLGLFALFMLTVLLEG